MIYRNIFFTVVALAVFYISPASAQGGFRVLGHFPTGLNDGCNFALIDDTAQRLYLIQADGVRVLDINQGHGLGQITNAAGFESFVIAPQMRRGFFTSGAEPLVQSVDLTGWRRQKGIKTEKNAGRIFLAPRSGLLYAFHQNENVVSVYESDDGDFMGDIDLPGKPGAMVGDAGNGMVYLYLEEVNKIAVIDPKKRKLAGLIDVPVTEGVSALALDSAQHRLFAGCRNGSIMMLNTNGSIAGSISVKGQVGSMSFDPIGRFLYATSEGTLSVANEYTANELRLLQSLAIPAGPQSVAVDSKGRRVFLVPLKTTTGIATNVVTVVGR